MLSLNDKTMTPMHFKCMVMTVRAPYSYMGNTSLEAQRWRLVLFVKTQVIMENFIQTFFDIYFNGSECLPAEVMQCIKTFDEETDLY